MIKLQNITKRYSSKIVVDNISLTVKKGEILGFLGPNGAGKTTTMRMITGSLAPTEGEIHIGGINISDNPQKAKELIGYLPETPPLYTDMTVKEYLKFVARIKKVSRKDERLNLDRVLNDCSLCDVSGRIIGNLSKGYRQRIGIASALIHNPPILIFDEPTVGLDPKQIIEIRNLIKSLSSKHTVVLSTHILSEVALTCSSIIIINDGKIVIREETSHIKKGLSDNEVISIKIKNRPNDESQFKKEIKCIPGVISLDQISAVEFKITLNKNEDNRELISERIVMQKLGLLEISSQTPSLEELFLKLTLTRG